MQSLVYKLFSLVPAILMINVRTADILCVVVVVVAISITSGGLVVIVGVGRSLFSTGGRSYRLDRESIRERELYICMYC